MRTTFRMAQVLLIVALAACGDGNRPAQRDRTGAETPGPPRAEAVGRELAVGEMTTIAGGGAELGDGGPARSAAFCETYDVAVDSAGALYVTDPGLFCDGPGGGSVRKIDASGVISTFAGGSGVVGFAGDGGPATKARLDVPGTVSVDGVGNVYITDQDNFRIRRVDTRGTITTVAGTGEQGHKGDGGPARLAQLTVPAGMAFDAHGNLFVAGPAGPAGPQGIQRPNRTGGCSGTPWQLGDGALGGRNWFGRSCTWQLVELPRARAAHQHWVVPGGVQRADFSLLVCGDDWWSDNEPRRRWADYCHLRGR